MDTSIQKREVLVITGLSGSGKSSVMHALEDLGFHCVDNFPLQLLSTFLEFVFQSHTHLPKVAFGIDVRGNNSVEDLFAAIEQLRKKENENCHVRVVFLNASEETLVKRFQETRRKHPLADNCSIVSAIKKERILMLPIEEIADEVHHTDRSNIHDLRRWSRDVFSGSRIQEVMVNVISFGFKRGVPAESNLVYDLRFLPNPYFIPALRVLDGRNVDVQSYLFSRKEVQVYWEKMEAFLKYSLQEYFKEGRFFANVAIGCTGGKHRSVAFVEKLSEQRWEHVKFSVYHRDIGKE